MSGSSSYSAAQRALEAVHGNSIPVDTTNSRQAHTHRSSQQQKSVASAETGNAHVTDNLGEQNAVLRSPGYLRNITEEEDRQQQVPQSTKRSNTPPIRGENTIRYTSTDTAIHRRDDASLSGSSRGDVQHATADDSASTYSQCSDLSPYRPAIAVPRGEQARVTSESAPGPSRSSLYPFNGTQSQTSPGLDSLDHALPASAVYERPAAVDVEMIRPVTVTNYGSLPNLAYDPQAIQSKLQFSNQSSSFYVK
ncbi:hypothetical protein M8818_001928 [Zalaria obscura]|uniref:Uncharacterized protein n=1 Tax=Zalaria obscura TaxID=2024903 RepID=A0ACC3SIH0_9PEZI